MNFTIRTMTRADLELASEWARQEGWNPGLDDVDPFYAADPEGFLIGEVDGEPASVISVVRYGSDYAFLGFYICAPKFRGQGLGWKIWQAGMEFLGDRTIGLDGVIDQQDNYRKSGFVLAHRNIRFGGCVEIDTVGGDSVTPVTPPVMHHIVHLDQNLCPAPRKAFTTLWARNDISSRFSLLLEENGISVGWGTIRKCHDGHKIGPLLAPTVTGAEALFRGLCHHVGKSTIYLDVPEPNKAALVLADKHGLSPVFETARMYRGNPPSLPLEQVWGITTFELG
ncbi:MAG: GNAT family N-acetyltransferase [Maricaulis sp.]|nr:GNAT family N-acetyltransferase [Maricaulis sp.]